MSGNILRFLNIFIKKGLEMIEKMIMSSFLLKQSDLLSALELEAEVTVTAHLELVGKSASKIIDVNEIFYVSIRQNYLIFTQKEKGGQWGYKLEHSIQLDVEPHPCPITNDHRSSGTVINRIKMMFVDRKQYFQIVKVKGGNLKNLYFALCDKPLFFSELKQDFQGIKKVKEEQNIPCYNVYSKFSRDKYFMKTISREYLSQNQLSSNFHRQLSVLMKGKHKNISKLERVYRSSHNIYMVFEFRQFRLSDFVTAFGYPDYEGKKTILKGVLNGISHLHQQNIIHGSLSSSNIYLTYTAEKQLSVKIGDFQQNLEKCSKYQDIQQIGQIYLELLYEKFIYINPESIDLTEVFGKSSMVSEEQTQGTLKIIHALFEKSHLKADQILEHPYFKNTSDLWTVQHLQIKQ